MDVELALHAPGGEAAQGKGSMLFTAAGLTGEAVFNVSRLARPGTELTVNFFPNMEVADVRQWLHRVFGERTREVAEHAIDYILPAALGRQLLARQRIKPTARVRELDERVREGLLAEMTGVKLTVRDTLGWRAAESAAGGVNVREIDPRTYQSRLVPGLYIVGRVLDVNADWGGFEQHFALASGFLAGSRLTV
jgi:predicted Rossmann fold flavoprotein